MESKKTQDLIKKITDTTALSVQLNDDLFHIVNPQVIKLGENFEFDKIQDILNTLPSCPTRMKIAGILALLKQNFLKVQLL